MKFDFTESPPVIHTANIIANFICLRVTYTGFKQGGRKKHKDYVEAVLA